MPKLTWSPPVWGPLGTYIVLKIMHLHPCTPQASCQYHLVQGWLQVGTETQKMAV